MGGVKFLNLSFFLRFGLDADLGKLVPDNKLELRGRNHSFDGCMVFAGPITM